MNKFSLKIKKQESFLINTIMPITITWALKANLLKGKDKKVITISSRRASNTVNIKDKYEGKYAYRSSKSALNSAMIALSHDLYKEKIIVTMIHPGRIATKMTNFNGIEPGKSANEIISFINMLRLKDTGSFFDAETKEILPW